MSLLLLTVIAMLTRYPDAKRILQEAISLDTRFLSRESIMDYSLLLGLDKNKKELVVGLVDAIGSYNLFKTIESRGKLALTRGGEVTIVSLRDSSKACELTHGRSLLISTVNDSRMPSGSTLS